MPYLGNKPVNNFVSFAKQNITGNGGTSYSLDYPVSNANDIELFINNVRQEPTEAYSASGATLTLTGAISSTDDVYVIFRGRALQTAQHPADSALEAASANIDSGTLYVDPVNSRVGIGTVAPDYALHLKGSFPYIAFEDTDNGATSQHTITGNSDGNVYFDSVINSSSGNSGFRFRQNGAAKTSLTIDANGYVNKPYIPAFSYTSNGVYSISTTTQEKFTNANVFSAGVPAGFALNNGNHFNAATGEFTAPVSGRYMFTVDATLDNFSSGYFYIYLYVNNGSSAYKQFSQQGSVMAQGSISVILDLAANDYVDARWINNYTTPRLLYTTFSGHLIG